MRVLLIMLLMASLVLSGCFKELPIEQVQKCEFSSDCIQVYTAGCCKCPTTINKDYADYWEKLGKSKKENCEGAICDQCGPKALGTDCINQTCFLLSSTVGLGIQ